MKELLVFTIALSVIISCINCVDNKDNIQYNKEYTEKWIKIIDKFENFTNIQTNEFLTKLNSVKNVLQVSSTCIMGFEQLLSRATKDEWALKMLESSGRWPSGMLSGSFSSFGDYDQCLAIKSDANILQLSGKYCFLELRPPKPVQKINLNNTKYKDYYYESVVNYWIKMDGFAPLANGICVPSVCTENEIQLILTNTLTSLTDLRMRVKYCSTQEDIDNKPLKFGQKIAIAIVLVNVILITIGTLISFMNINKDSITIKFIECFSFVKNNKTLFKINTTPTKDGQFQYIHGLRVISIFWVLISHIYLFHPFPEFQEKVSPVLRLADVRTIIQYLSTHLIINAGLAVGTFYIISGCLTIYSILPVFKKNPLNIFNFILLRWLRFTPPTIGMICFIIIWPLFGSGPLFHPEFTDKVTDPCYTSWWTNLLFINNWMHPSYMCNNITWYLSCDLQLHILLYFVIYFYYRRPLLSRLYVGLMIILGFAVPVAIVLTGISDAPNPSIFLHPENKFPIEKVGLFIFATYNQLIPYFFGVILGITLIRKTKLKIISTVRWILWIVLLPITILIPFSSYNFAQSEAVVEMPLESAIVFGIIRLLWSAGVTWICHECATGSAGLINNILSSSCLQPLSRLTFSIYLIHILPVWHNFFRIRSPITISHESLLFMACGNAIQAILLSYLLYIIFESPYVNVCKLLFMPSINKHSLNTNNKDVNENTIELNKSKSSNRSHS